MSLVRTALFVLLMSLGGWAHCEDFCGPGPHRKTSSCHCPSQSSAAICLCNPAQDPAHMSEPLRECLPVLVPFQLLAPPGCFSLWLGQGTTHCDQVRLCRTDLPAVPPPR